MDFGKFNMRGKAEEGQAFPILHPETLQPIVENGKEARFVIRGSASPSVQQAQTELLAHAMTEVETAATVAPTFGWMHDQTVKQAVPLIADFENVEIDGVALNVEDAKRFLDLVFPRVGKDDETGKYKILNKTFAMQVIERCAELDAALGNV